MKCSVCSAFWPSAERNVSIRVFRIVRSMSEQCETPKKEKFHAAAGSSAKQLRCDDN